MNAMKGASPTQAKTGQARAGQGRTDQNRTEQNRSDQGGRGQLRLDRTRPDLSTVLDIAIAAAGDVCITDSEAKLCSSPCSGTTKVFKKSW